MKKWLLLLAVIVFVGGAYYVARSRTMIPIWLQPKMGKVSRGDIRVPISAAGLIHATQDIEIKSMASGRIMEVPVVEGDFVHKGDKVVILDPIDEQRNTDRAQADYDRAKAMLKQAEVAIDRASVAIDTANAHLEEMNAQVALLQWQYDKRNSEPNQYAAEELKALKTQLDVGKAQQESARVAVESAKLAKEDALAARDSQKAVVDGTDQTLADAKKRLSETTVVAPTDTIVTQVLVKPGMLVQSATSSFVGGTLLMSVADVSEKKVIAKLDEADYGRVLKISPVDALPDMPELREAAKQDAEDLQRRSGKVTITVDAFPEQKFEGVIERVEPQGKQNAGSTIIQFDVHVRITDPKRHQLPLGAQAQVEFTVESAMGALLVPADAVKLVDEKRGVYIKLPPQAGEQYGKKFVLCRFGISDGTNTQVIEAIDGELKVDEEVYTKLPPNPGEETKG